MATAADGMHPTGMHSCFDIFFLQTFWSKAAQNHIKHMSWGTGCPPFSPPWLLSDGRQVPTGLDTDVMLFHHLRMYANGSPLGTAISSHLAMGVGACMDTTHVCPTQIFY